jgi:hypothetical protein
MLWSLTKRRKHQHHLLQKKVSKIFLANCGDVVTIGDVYVRDEGVVVAEVYDSVADSWTSVSDTTIYKRIAA